MRKADCRHCVCLRGQCKDGSGEWICDEVSKPIRKIKVCPEGMKNTEQIKQVKNKMNDEFKPGYYMYEEDTHKRIYNISEITINKENVQLIHYHVIDCRYGDDRIEVLLNQVTELTERSGMVLELSKVKEMSAEEYGKYYDIIRMLLI